MAAAGPTQTILLVEDDPALALGVGDALEFEGFGVVHAKTGHEGVRAAADRSPDCIVLDLMLPDLNGFEVCTRIRRTNPLVPILILTARSEESDKIRGLDAGADDYVTKPFSINELVARIRAILRRIARSAAASSLEPYAVGNAVVDAAAQTVTRDRRASTLSFYEAEVLRMLRERAGQPVSREEILDKIWGLEPGHSNRTVDNVIVKLRRKIEPNPEEPRHILTVYGTGYKLVP